MSDILLLDIDGVLRHKTRDPARIRPELAARVDAFARERQLSILISSTWRLTYDRAFFRREISERVMGVLPCGARADALDQHNRGALIEKTLAYRYGRAVPPFVIFDDSPRLFPDDAIRAHCIFVHPDRLLTDDDIIAAGDRLDRLSRMQRSHDHPACQ